MKQNILNLLVWESTAEQCEEHLNTLRNLGYALRERLIESHEQLVNALDEKSWDLLICNTDLIEPPVEALQQQLSEKQPTLISVFLLPQYNADTLYKLYSASANLVIEQAHTGLLSQLLPRLIQAQTLADDLQTTQQKVRDELQRNHTLMDSSRDAIAYIQDGMHAYTNLSYLEMFGLDDQDELDCMPLLDLIEPDSRDEIKSILRQFSRHEINQTSIECNVLRKDNPHSVSIDFAEAQLDGETSIQLIIRDNSHDEALTQKLAEMSRKDLITDLDNRRHFIDQLREINLSNLKQAPQSILFIRIDDYNSLQRDIGIASCDILIRDISDIVKTELQASSCLARFADDIFTSIYPTTSDTDIGKIAQQLCDAIAQQEIVIDNKLISCTVSIGISPLNGKQQSPEKILIDVERACNNAQHSGGNQIQLLHNLEKRPAIANSGEGDVIRTALKNNQFRLVFQPIVSLHASPGERYQVLIRMMSDSGEEIAPSQFLPNAEAAGLMAIIDRWVIVNSINTLVKYRQQGKKVQLFIKLSSDSISDAETIKWISKYLHESRIPADCLVFEINQEDVLTLHGESKNFIKQSRQLHCLTAIDHVQGLIETIEDLALLDVDFLKIDGSLISNLSSDRAVQDMSKKISAIAQANNKQTIAEFVHDANTLAVLWQHGINFVQGYYLQQPNQEMSYNFDG